MGTVAQSAGWGVTFVLLAAASVVAMFLCALTIKSEKN
jgi:sugar phosphate permease